MPQMVLARNFILRTTLGHTIGFKKGEPVFVHPLVVNAALGVGAEFIEESEKEEVLKEEAARPKVPQGVEREAAAFKAFETMLSRNERNDFSAGGKPNLKPLSHLMGFDMDAKERDVLWDKFQNKDSE